MLDVLTMTFRCDEKTGVVFKRFKSVPDQIVGVKNASTGYLEVRHQGRKYQLHRIIWLLTHGDWPRGCIDHINGDRTDNRPANLRDVTRQENSMNQALNSRNTSGVVGVRWRERYGKWEAQIKVSGRHQYLGRFASFEAAVAARKEAERLNGFHPNHGRAA